MKVTAEKNEQVANMVFASIYPLYLNRLEKNGRTKEELDQVIKWLTGFDQYTLQALIDEKVTYRTFFQKAKILASSIFRPSYQAVEYYRENMTGSHDPLFNFKYTLRFLSMLDVKELILPESLNVPVLVAVGDKDELFTIESVEEVFDDVPGTKKEFLVLKDTNHATFPDASWEQLVVWLDSNF